MKKIILAASIAMIGLGLAQTTFAAEKICTMDYRPMCGVDGKTYGNACGAEAAEVKIAYEGECKASAVLSPASETSVVPPADIVLIKGGNPFKNASEKFRIERNIKSHISKIATNQSAAGTKFRVSKMTWDTQVTKDAPHTVDVTYSDGKSTFTETFIATIKR